MKKEEEHIKSILIVKLSAIGDVVQSLPVLEVVKKNFPDARIDWVVEEDASEIIAGHPYLDRIFISRRKSWQKEILKVRGYPSAVREIRILLRDLRSNKYDVIMDLQGLFKSGIVTGLSKGRRKIGMEGAREGGWLFLTEPPIPVDFKKHAIDRYLKFAQHLKCKPTSWKGRIPISQVDKNRIKQILRSEGLSEKPIIAINPLAKWRTKLWKTDKFAKLSDRIMDELSCNIVLTGSENDRETVETISDMMKGNPINLAGRTSLKELAYLYSRCAVLVSTDTGPMHMACAMGCPVVAIFGPTAPWRTGPYGRGHRIVRTGIQCSPCFKRKCKHVSCMKDIQVDDVFENIKSILLKS